MAARSGWRTARWVGCARASGCRHGERRYDATAELPGGAETNRRYDAPAGCGGCATNWRDDELAGRRMNLVERRDAGERLIGLELLRFLAAIGVLIWHYQHFMFVGHEQTAWDWGRLPFRSLFLPFYT